MPECRMYEVFDSGVWLDKVRGSGIIFRRTNQGVGAHNYFQCVDGSMKGSAPLLARAGNQRSLIRALHELVRRSVDRDFAFAFE